jgi:hypothetical protein
MQVWSPFHTMFQGLGSRGFPSLEHKRNLHYCTTCILAFKHGSVQLWDTTKIVIHHYALHFLGLTIFGLEKHKGLGLEFVSSQALKPYGLKFLRTFCFKTPSPKAWRPTSQGLGLGLLTGQNNLFILGFNPRTHELL